MKPVLDWTSKEIVNAFDELSLWSAPFGRLMLENIPMKSQSKVLDIGFGTGFPIIELSQRFDASSTIYGIDIWDNAIEKVKSKISLFDIDNIIIIEQSAENIPLDDETIDLVCSNLGINNFSNKEKVLQEVYRVLQANGNLSITTNPIGTFEELEAPFKESMVEMNLNTGGLSSYFKARGTEEEIKNMFIQSGFELIKVVRDKTSVRYISGLSLLNHHFIRIAFRESWEKLIPTDLRDSFFKKLESKIDSYIKVNGEFRMSIPMLYMEFKKV